MPGGNPDQPVVTQAPRQRSTDARTLARKFNEGMPKNPSYEFPKGRKFYQPKDQEHE